MQILGLDLDQGQQQSYQRHAYENDRPVPTIKAKEPAATDHRETRGPDLHSRSAECDRHCLPDRHFPRSRLRPRADGARENRLFPAEIVVAFKVRTGVAFGPLNPQRITSEFAAVILRAVHPPCTGSEKTRTFTQSNNAFPPRTPAAPLSSMIDGPMCAVIPDPGDVGASLRKRRIAGEASRSLASSPWRRSFHARFFSGETASPKVTLPSSFFMRWRAHSRSRSAIIAFFRTPPSERLGRFASWC